VSRRAISTGDELQFVVFRVGSQELAFSIAQVERILRYEPPQEWSGCPEFLAGRITYGAAQIPLMDLRVRAGSRPMFHEETRTMVLTPEAAPLAVVVDQVKEVVRVDTRTIAASEEAIPGLPSEAASGRIERAGRTIMIVNAARLLTGAERLALSEART